MTKKKSKPIKYRANTRRSEAYGVGIVEKGEEVTLGEMLDPGTIAHLIHAGYYTPDRIDPAVQEELDKLKAG